MKPKPTPDNGDVPQHLLNKELTRKRIEETSARAQAQRTREKMHRLQLAKSRGELIEKNLVQNQAAFIFGSIRQKMLSAPLAWSRQFVGLKTQKEAHELLTKMQYSLLEELADFPRKTIDPHWMESLDED